jgi:hypothetical protein
MLVIFLQQYSGLDIEYTVFHPGNNDNNDINLNKMNSVFGTGNKLKDIALNSACISICRNSSDTYTKGICCTGENLVSIKCMDRDYCKKLYKDINSYLTFLIITVYFSTAIVTMLIMFLIFFILSRRVGRYKITQINNTKQNYSKQRDSDKININMNSNRSSEIDNMNLNNEISDKLSLKQAYINGLVAAILVLFTALILPIIIMKIISVYKGKSMTRMLGGNFQSISTTKLVISVDIKDSERKKKYMILDKNNQEEDIVAMARVRSPNISDSNLNSKNSKNLKIDIKNHYQYQYSQTLRIKEEI